MESKVASMSLFDGTNLNDNKDMKVITTYIFVNDKGFVDLMLDYTDKFCAANLNGKDITEEEFRSFIGSKGYTTFNAFRHTLKVYAITRTTSEYTYKVFHYYRDVNTHWSGFIGEMFEQLEISQITELAHIRVRTDLRGKGLGTSIIKDMIAAHSKDLLVLKAGATVDEYSEPPEGEELIQLLNKLCRLYQSLNFININDVVGCYEDFVPHLYLGNERGLEFLGSLVDTYSKYEYANCERFISRVREQTVYGLSEEKIQELYNRLPTQSKRQFATKQLAVQANLETLKCESK